MAINKVIYGGTTLIDLSGDSLASADQLMQGVTAHDRTGALITGTATGAGDHTVTIASSGYSARCYVQLNGAGQTYYSSGSTIPFSHSAGDELYIYCTGSRGGGTITVNGAQVASNPYNPVSYTLALPFADVTVNLRYGSTSQVDVTFTVPTIEITENGVHDVSSYAYANVNVSGGGGASNFVQGTFTTQSSAGVQNISVPYTGGGYPVSIMVYVAGGAYNSAISAWYNSMQRYAVGQWTCHKSVQTSAPTYATSGTQNQGVTTAIYKNSTSSSTSYTRTSAMNTNVFSSSYASNAALTCVRYHSGNVLSVYVNTSSYGLLPGIEYQYQIVYSS